MPENELHAVTGAFGYSGQHLAARLLQNHVRVRALTTRAPIPIAGQILESRPLRFDAPAQLCESLRGARVLYNTYWVRFNHRRFTFAAAVDNSRRLFEAAAQAKVERIVHVSITNPAEDSPFEYFRGKAQVERALRQCGVPHSILRPAVFFGGRDILLNNIAWLLRRFPIFGLFGDGQYRLQPIHVDDMALLAEQHGRKSGSHLVNAIGPETFTFRELVQELGQAIGRPRRLITISPCTALLFARALGLLLGDVLLTREEIGGLMANLLCVDAPPAGATKLSLWARQHAPELGRCYASELARR